MPALALLCLLAAAPAPAAPASEGPLRVEVLQLFRPRAAVVWTAQGPRQLRAGPGGVSVDGAPPVAAVHFVAPIEVELAGGLRRAYAGALEAQARAGALRLFNRVALEDYVASVVGAELPAHVRPAALEALAVVARSFALSRARAGVHLCDRTHCQLYQGRASARPQARAAAAATAGEVLLGRDGVAPALHHAACGGRTADAAEIWPAASAAEREAAVAVDDPLPSGGPACAPAPPALDAEPLRWSARVPEATLLRALGLPAGGGLAVRAGPGGRVETAYAGGRAFTAEALQLALGRALGRNPLRSARFSAERTGPGGSGIYRFSGSGHGHGAGLCQRGAAALATIGYDRHLILARYFPRLSVGKATGQGLPLDPESG